MSFDDSNISRYYTEPSPVNLRALTNRALEVHMPVVYSLME